ncbi:MAG: HEPN domain-containing protein [Ruminococcus sp.]|nr:HEPN domain-containing protein [Ruminococcus sp.]MCM1381661.1 HEPN domain-containing protein [Muribaculaceae bacterium]MCM1480995.1 HEPN domain-containing protein [Muribaculaceae bacterium]
MSRNSSHSTDSKRYYDWLYHACLDIMSARALMEDERLSKPVVFHCQQAMEKGLKAFLLYKHRKLFDGHNLTWLCKQAAMTDQSFTKFIGKSTLLNRYYIETRYPADIPEEIGRELVKEILSATEEMLEEICSLTKFDYRSYRKKGKYWLTNS